MPGPVLSNPPIQFVGLAALTLLARGALTRVGPPAAGSAAALMAIGNFSLDALQHLPVPDLSTVTQLVAIELLVLAVLLGVGLAVAHLKGTAAPLAVDLRERYGAGTWVAASSVLAGVARYLLLNRSPPQELGAREGIPATKRPEVDGLPRPPTSPMRSQRPRDAGAFQGGTGCDRPALE